MKILERFGASHQQRCDEEENISSPVAQVLGQKHTDADDLVGTQSDLSNLIEKEQRSESNDSADNFNNCVHIVSYCAAGMRP